jgi:hypothetical protein
MRSGAKSRLLFLLALVGLVGCGGLAMRPPDPDGGTADCISPSCLVDLTRTCRPAGTCISQADQFDPIMSFCSQNGVIVTRVMNSYSWDDEYPEVDTFWLNGSVCYSIEIPWYQHWEVKNATGSLVAVGDDGASPTITCTGEKSASGYLCPGIIVWPWRITPACSTGTCAP